MWKLLSVVLLALIVTGTVIAKDCLNERRRISAIEQNLNELEESLQEVNRQIAATRKILNHGKKPASVVTISNPSIGIYNFEQFINKVASGDFDAESQFGSTSSHRRYTQVTDLLNVSQGSDYDFELCPNEDCFDQYDTAYGHRRIGPNGEVYRSDSMAFDSELGSDLKELQQNIVERMRSGTNVKKCINEDGIEYCGPENDFYLGGRPSTRWYFEYGNRAYVVDTKFPLSTNPVGILKKDTNEGFVLQ